MEKSTSFPVLAVVEDAQCRIGIEQLLKMKGYPVTFATSRQHALSHLAQARYALLLLNLARPDEGGRILDFVRAQGLDLATVIINDTGPVSPAAEITTTMRSDAINFLRKPFSPEELLTSLANALQKRPLKPACPAISCYLDNPACLYRLIVDHSPDLILIVDPQGRILYLNQRAKTLLGFDPETLIGQPLLNLVTLADREKAQQLLDALATQPSDSQSAELSLVCHPDDARQTPQVVVEISAQAILDDEGKGATPHCTGSHMVAHDITEHRRTEEALRCASARLEHVVSASPAVIYSRQPGTGMPIRFISANVANLLGYRADEFLADTGLFRQRVHRDDWPSLDAGLDFSEECPSASREYRMQHRDGHWLWIQDTTRLIRDSNGQPLELVGSWLDHTEARQLAEQLSYQANHDSLTELANRRAFELHLQKALDSAWQHDTGHVLLYLDLDEFKIINDTCGHVAGDVLLHELAMVLRARVRRQDMLARLGGDEFGVLMEDCSLPEALWVANMLCNVVSDFRFGWGDKIFQIGVSIGVVAIDACSKSCASVLSAADSACYAAKDAGRNRTHVYTETDLELARRRGEMHWVAHINQALEDNRFQLAFQPIVPTRGQSEGHHYELLLRMQDESGQIVMPGTFLPAAERYHLAGKLDQWVVSTALDWLSSHPSHLDNLSLCSINLSGHSLGNGRLLSYLTGRLAHLPAINRKLCFEITETAAITHLPSALHFIRTLKNLGCRFALDDFGSGFSSFAYLKKLPVDFLKIDGLFVEDMIHNPVSSAMVSSINDIGHVMGMETIAEFVENDQILNKLRAMGVNYAQGYGVGKPRPLSEMTTVFA